MKKTLQPSNDQTTFLLIVWLFGWQIRPSGRTIHPQNVCLRWFEDPPTSSKGWKIRPFGEDAKPILRYVLFSSDGN